MRFGLFLLVLACASLAAQTNQRAKSVRVQILSTMLTDTAGIGEWGFAALVEVDGRRILFDTGARPDTVLKNAREMKVDLAGVTEVILTHNHGDHTNGLLTLRREYAKQNPKALSRAYVADGMFLSRPGPGGAERNVMIGHRTEFEQTGGAFEILRAPREIAPGAWLTGPVARKHAERNWGGAGVLRLPDGTTREDNIPEDQSLVIDTERGLVLVSGCGHAGIINTAEHARRAVREAPLHAAIGGFHLFPLNDDGLAWTAGKLRELGLRHFLGAHCTGIEAVYRIRQLAGLGRTTCVVGAVGAGFTLEAGIQPGAIAR